ncbi:MAG: HAD-IIIA family hydrolase [Ruminococcaceae bacterium]|nr:HAD-IIIA family hydrolase [Oscillospiraceae bacterium]
MKTVIMAGGKGTRIASLCATLPKPMLPLAGVPVLEREIAVLRRQGFTDIILVIGHLGDAIRAHFGDGSALGVHISYVEEQTPLGTAGALALLRETLSGDDFLLLCGDLLFDVDLGRFLAYHRARGGVATVLAHPNGHPHDSTVIRTEEDGRVTALLPPAEDRGDVPNRVNAGLHLFSPRVLERFGEVKKTDLDRDVLRPLAAEGVLYAYDSPEYVKDMGTPARLAEAEADLRSGRVARQSLALPQRAFFLDRDGTVNRYVGFLRRPEELELCPGAAEAIRMLNQRGYPVIIVTNQPVLARGEVTEEGLRRIHDRLETLLGREGAFVNGILYCPHHPDRGFAGEIPHLKIECDCRKPKPGLLLRAAERLHIDLAASWMIGDNDRDTAAGRAAGCHTAAIGAEPDAELHGNDLLDCVRQILENEV